MSAECEASHTITLTEDHFGRDVRRRPEHLLVGELAVPSHAALVQVRGH